MRLVETIEKGVKDLSQGTLLPQIKRCAWYPQLRYQYMMARRVVATRSLNLPGSVQIEINTDCNRRCWYCSNYSYPKAPELMDRELYESIVDELAAIRYRGQIVPHRVSEPLKHPYLPEWVAYARQKATEAEIVIYTNGDYLDRGKFDELRDAGVDLFIITQHGERDSLALADLRCSLKGKEKAAVSYRTPNDFKLTNRGIPGLIPAERRATISPCFHTNYHLQVLVNGDVSQCCAGFVGEHIFGNVQKQSLLEVWRNPGFKQFRQEVGRGRFNLDICQRCVYDRGEIEGIIPMQRGKLYVRA